MPVDSSSPFNAAFRLYQPPPDAPQTDGTDAPPRTDGRVKAGGAGPAQKADKAVAPGTSDVSGPVPDPSTPQTGNHTQMAMVAASLFIMMPTMSSDDADVELASLGAKMKDATDKVDKGEIKVDGAQKQAALEAKELIQKKAEEAHQKAEEAHKHASLADKFKLAFSFIGAALTAIAGAVLIATGIGVAAGACLIAASVIMFALAVDQTMSMASTEHGGSGKGWIAMLGSDIAKLETSDPKKQEELAQKWTMGIEISLSITAAILGIAGAAVNPAGAEAEVSMAFKVSEEALAIAGAVNDAGDASAQVASSVYNFQATKQEAASIDSKAQAKGFDAIGKMLDGMIDAALARLSASGNRFSAVLDSIMSAMNDRSDVMAHTQFRA